MIKIIFSFIFVFGLVWGSYFIFSTLTKTERRKALKICLKSFIFGAISLAILSAIVILF